MCTLLLGREGGSSNRNDRKDKSVEAQDDSFKGGDKSV